MQFTSFLTLIVDDNPENRNILARRLQRKGLQVMEATNGQQALDLIQQHNFHLVLLDIIMPVMDGYQVLESLKTDPILRHLPVIVISSLDDMGSIARCIELGAEDYLLKPFNHTLLNARINACLEKKKLRDQEIIYQQQIEAANRQLEDQVQRHERELKMARRVQASLLPGELPKIPHWEFAACWLPAHQVAGDYYDFISYPGGDIGLTIGDVTDKGIPAALFMVFAQNKVRTCMANAATPALGVTEANRLICMESSHGLYNTLVYARMTPESGQVVYVNAGHDPPLFYRASQGRLESLSPTGKPLGMEAEGSYQQSNLSLERGDFILFYTDGVPDTQDEQGESFGRERLQAILLENAHHPAKDIVSALENVLNGFRSLAEHFDDTTMVLAKRLE